MNINVYTISNFRKWDVRYGLDKIMTTSVERCSSRCADNDNQHSVAVDGVQIITNSI
jgi:hypothetical protein